MPTWYLAGTERYRGPVLPAAGGGGGDITTGLIHQWWMDDSHINGTPAAVDSVGVGGTLNALVLGGVTSTAAPAAATFSTARIFDGIAGTRLEISSSIGSIFNWSGGSFSIGGWIWLENNNIASGGGSSMTPLDDETGTTYLRIANVAATPGGLRVTVGDSNSTGSVLTSTGTVMSAAWHHIFYTNSGGGEAGVKVMYLDGSPVSASVTSGAGNFGVSSSQLGTGTGTDGYLSFGSKMYNWVCYSRALTAADVLALYNSK